MSNPSNPFQDNKQPKMPRFNMNWLYTIILIALAVLFFTGGGDALVGEPPAMQEASYTKFKIYVEKGYAKNVVVDNDKREVQMYVRPEHIRDVFGATARQVGTEPYVKVEVGSLDQLDIFLAEAQKTGKILDYSYKNKESNFLTSLLVNFGGIILIIAVWIFMLRRMGGGAGGGGVFNVGKSKAKMYEKGNDLGITFKDVAGQEGAKQEVQEIVDFLKAPQKYTELGGKIPKGALLVGPPGTGKTLLAKAVAGEAGVPFFSMSGSDFVEMFVGVGASRVRDLFRQAKEKSPCIIFIDEIDSVGQKRNAGGMPAQRCADQTLNAMLVEMDGFGSNDGVIVIAATNRPDILDPALLRPGRFDRQVHVDLPTLKGREDILRIHAAKVKLAPDVDLLRLARGTSGHSGADLANIINEAALLAARRNLDAIPQAILEEARDKVFWGSERRSAGFTRKEYETTAWHESGHALLQLLLPHADPLHKVTIIPRGRALGVTMTLPEKDVLNRTKGYFLDELAVLAGGRIAEEMHTQDISTGAMSDIAYTTQIARAMVCRYGMSARFGFQNFVEPNAFAVEEAPPPYSQKTAEAIDEEVKHLVDAAYAKAAELLTANRDKLERLATTLLEKETMDGRDVEALVGIRKDHPEDTPPAPETPPEAEEERPHEA